MSRGLKIFIIVIVLLIASQWVLISLVYQGKLNNNLTLLLAKTYNLKAGEITDKDGEYKVSLAEYLEHRNFLKDNMTEQAKAEVGNIDDLAWKGVLKIHWLKNFSNSYNLTLTENEINDYMAGLIGTDVSFEEFCQQNYNLSWEKFKNMFVEPYILEEKVYYYLLDNFNDRLGIQAAQTAYEALESGEDFNTVAQTYATDETYLENYVWLKLDDLVGIYEPIAELNTGDFSRIVIVPGGYIIWHVQSMTEDAQDKVWQVNGLYIEALPLDDFFQSYLDQSQIKKKIK